MELSSVNLCRCFLNLCKIIAFTYYAKNSKVHLSVCCANNCCVWFLPANFAQWCPLLVLRNNEQLLPIAFLVIDSVLSCFFSSEKTRWLLTIPCGCGYAVLSTLVVSFPVPLLAVTYFLKWVGARIGCNIKDGFYTVACSLFEVFYKNS